MAEVMVVMVVMVMAMLGESQGICPFDGWKRLGSSFPSDGVGRWSSNTTTFCNNFYASVKGAKSDMNHTQFVLNWTVSDIEPYTLVYLKFIVTGNSTITLSVNDHFKQQIEPQKCSSYIQFSSTRFLIPNFETNRSLTISWTSISQFGIASYDFTVYQSSDWTILSDPKTEFNLKDFEDDKTVSLRTLHQPGGEFMMVDQGNKLVLRKEAPITYDFVHLSFRLFLSGTWSLQDKVFITVNQVHCWYTLGYSNYYENFEVDCFLPSSNNTLEVAIYSSNLVSKAEIGIETFKIWVGSGSTSWTLPTWNITEQSPSIANCTRGSTSTTRVYATNKNQTIFNYTTTFADPIDAVLLEFSLLNTYNTYVHILLNGEMVWSEPPGRAANSTCKLRSEKVNFIMKGNTKLSIPLQPSWSLNFIINAFYYDFSPSNSFAIQLFDVSVHPSSGPYWAVPLNDSSNFDFPFNMSYDDTFTLPLTLQDSNCTTIYILLECIPRFSFNIILNNEPIYKIYANNGNDNTTKSFKIRKTIPNNGLSITTSLELSAAPSLPDQPASPQNLTVTIYNLTLHIFQHTNLTPIPHNPTEWTLYPLISTPPFNNIPVYSQQNTTTPLFKNFTQYNNTVLTGNLTRQGLTIKSTNTPYGAIYYSLDILLWGDLQDHAVLYNNYNWLWMSNPIYLFEYQEYLLSLQARETDSYITPVPVIKTHVEEVSIATPVEAPKGLQFQLRASNYDYVRETGHLRYAIDNITIRVLPENLLTWYELAVVDFNNTGAINDNLVGWVNGSGGGGRGGPIRSSIFGRCPNMLPISDSIVYTSPKSPFLFDIIEVHIEILKKQSEGGYVVTWLLVNDNYQWIDYPFTTESTGDCGTDKRSFDFLVHVDPVNFVKVGFYSFSWNASHYIQKLTIRVHKTDAPLETISLGSSTTINQALTFIGQMKMDTANVVISAPVTIIGKLSLINSSLTVRSIALTVDGSLTLSDSKLNITSNSLLTLYGCSNSMNSTVDVTLEGKFQGEKVIIKGNNCTTFENLRITNNPVSCGNAEAQIYQRDDQVIVAWTIGISHCNNNNNNIIAIAIPSAFGVLVAVVIIVLLVSRIPKVQSVIFPYRQRGAKNIQLQADD